MKLKQLFAAALLVCSTGAWAQTDVTSTYLTNANFEADEALTATYLYGYGKDGSPYGLQPITGWTSVVTAGDNSNNSYPNSGMAGGVFSYGSSTQLKGNSKAAPATNPDGEASGKCFGFFGVWSCGGYYYQNVTLAAGKYTITVPMYNQSGTQANTTYTGFFPTSGTNKTVAVNPTVGQWVDQTVTFTLADATEGQIRIGYQSTGSGSGANPMLFIDCVKIEFTAIVVRDVLETAITAATTVNSRINNSDLTAAISTAQGVYDDENATQEGVNNAAATLNTAVETAMAAHIANGGDPTLALANSDLSSLDGWTVASTSGYNDKGNGLIGTYNVRFSAATVDETHLATEYCLGFEARWSGNYASYNQTTVVLPAGVYTLTYDVENVNDATSNLTYADYNFVQVGETKKYSSATEWMAAKSGWTTHTIRVTLNEPAPITVSFGYGTGDNNPSADVTPALYVSHVNLSYSNFLDGAKAAWDDAVTAAEDAKTANPNVVGSELTALDAELAKAEPTTVDGYNTATNDLTTATEALVSAAPAYNALAAVNAMITAAGTLEYADDEKKPSASVTATSASDATSKATSQTTALRAYYESHAKAEGVVGAVDYSSAVADANAETNTGWTNGVGIKNGDQPYTNSDGTTASKYLDGGWASSAPCNIDMTRDVVIPAGRYILTVKARGAQALTKYTLSIGGEIINLPHSNGGSNGVFGNGWEDATIEFDADGTAQTLEVIAQSTANQQWFSMNDFRLVKISDVANMKVGANTYATFIAPFDVEIPNPEKVKAYKVLTATGAFLNLTPVETTIPANTPVVLLNNNETEVNKVFNGGFADNETHKLGMLTGVYTATSAPVNSYVLQNLNEKVGFYQVIADNQPTVPANRAYLTTGSEVKAFFFDKETGINGVLNEIAAGNIYDLSGRKVAKMQKGQTYIIDGKKVNVK